MHIEMKGRKKLEHFHVAAATRRLEEQTASCRLHSALHVKTQPDVLLKPHIFTNEAMEENKQKQTKEGMN